MEKVIKFGSDTKHRKQWFTGISFSHPAKMSLPLQLWLIDNFTQEGETILDPMAGMGTILVACSVGRNVICVDLEQKFVDMMNGNWEKIRQRGSQLGYSMGTATILQGDARQLEGLLVDKCIFSPPYAESVSINQGGERESHQGKRAARLEKAGYDLKDYQGGHGRNLQQDWSYGNSADNIGNLPYGEIDRIITSPPYEEAMGKKHHSPRADKLAQEKSNPVTYTGSIDAVISSPPYEGITGEGKEIGSKGHAVGAFHYGNRDAQIGNLKSDSYLSAMARVYSQCHAILKDGGLLILVTKNFIRDKKVIRLDLDMIKLCEQAGFKHTDSYHRKLSAQSFWRTIYYARYPDVEKIELEDILIFQKERRSEHGR